MKKLDKSTFEYQLNLIRSEVRNDRLQEEVTRLKGELQSSQAHTAYLVEQVKSYQDELNVTKLFIERHLK